VKLFVIEDALTARSVPQGALQAEVAEVSSKVDSVLTQVLQNDSGAKPQANLSGQQLSETEKSEEPILLTSVIIGHKEQQKPEPTQEKECAKPGKRWSWKKHQKSTVEDYEKFAPGWIERFNELLRTENVFEVAEKAA